MIWKIWLVASVVVLAIAWVLMVPYSPPPRSLSATAIESYRAEGEVPARDAFKISTSVGHEIFEVPEGDTEHLAEAEANTGEMPGMPGMTPSTGQATMPMQMPPEEHAGNAGGTSMEPMTEQGNGAGMAMGEKGHEEGTGMAMGEQGHAAEEEGGHGGGGPMAGISVHTVAKMAMPGGKAMVGALDKPGRVVEVTMKEWGYEPARIMAKPGEHLRLVVHNGGMLPHEFMVMAPPGMQALNYRVERADWNLTEHEAIFERPVMMPGDTIELDVTVHKPGRWMFMCMFPFHMRMGMMGMIMTEGSGGAMPMGDMKM